MNRLKQTGAGRGETRPLNAQRPPTDVADLPSELIIPRSREFWRCRDVERDWRPWDWARADYLAHLSWDGGMALMVLRGRGAFPCSGLPTSSNENIDFHAAGSQTAGPPGRRTVWQIRTAGKATVTGQ